MPFGLRHEGFRMVLLPSPTRTVKVPLSQPCFDHFLGPVLGAMMKQVCWHSRPSKAYRGLPEARGQSEAHGDSNLYDCWGPLATPQGCCACVGQAVVCRASSLHLSLLRQKNEKMPIEDIHLALAPNPRVLLGFCAPSSVVSVAGGWWLLQ